MNTSQKEENTKVSSLNFLYIAGRFNSPLESLSRMRGNLQVRFLGDKGEATRLSYLTKPSNMKL
jgi:hypothetical protein